MIIIPFMIFIYNGLKFRPGKKGLKNNDLKKKTFINVCLFKIVENR